MKDYLKKDFRYQNGIASFAINDEKKSWINYQYFHPIESLHTLDEVLSWFKNDIEFINYIPSCDFDIKQNYEDLFKKT